MSRLVVIALIIVGVAGAGVAAWTFLPATQQDGAAVPAAGGPSGTDAERRENRERFFGGDTDRNIRGGQEMRPRW